MYNFRSSLSLFSLLKFEQHQVFGDRVSGAIAAGLIQNRECSPIGQLVKWGTPIENHNSKEVFALIGKIGRAHV